MGGMGAMQRRKGARFEREVANAFAILFPEAKRGIGQARDSGEVADVSGTPFWPECKRGAGSTVDAALAQALASKKVGSGPALAIVRRNGKRATASMYLEDFLFLLAGHAFAQQSPEVLADVRARISAAVKTAEGGDASGKKPPKKVPR